MAILPPYETSVYLYLLRHSRLKGRSEVRVGKRTIGEGIGKGTRSKRGGNYRHVTAKLNALAEAGFISAGDTNRAGTLYAVALPAEVPEVRKRLTTRAPAKPADHYDEPKLRAQLFNRDQWRCQYCGETVTAETATLDHRRPVSAGGTNDPENLTTACLMCNSIKSGRSVEEAAPDILRALQERRAGATRRGASR